MHITRRLLRGSAIVATFVVAAAGGAFLTGSLASASGHQHRVSPFLARHFALLSRPTKVRAHIATLARQDAHTALAQNGNASLDELLSAMATPQDPSARLGLEPADIQSVTIPAAGANPAFAVYVVPGSNGACLISLPPGRVVTGTNGVQTTLPTAPLAVCGTDATMGETGLYHVTQMPNGESVVYGMVPNGNTSVSVQDASGTTQTAPVTNNVFATFAPTGFQSVRYSGSDGRGLTEAASVSAGG